MLRKAKRHIKHAFMLALFVVSLTIPLVFVGNVHVPIARAAQTIVSQVARTPQGKAYLEVDGKPYLYLSVENWGQEQILGDSVNPGGSDWRYNTALFSTPLPQSWLENVFEKTKAAGYTTISMILKWNEIETSQGTFDWTLVDRYIGWANQYGLRIDWVWFGAMNDCGTRFPGQTNGWMTWVPPYVQDLNKYFGNGTFTSDIYCSWLPDGGTHNADAQFLFNAERNAVAQLFAHLAVYDTNHRTILFQVMNEPNLHPQWNSEQSVIIGLVSQMAQVIKNSDYVVATRVNYSGTGPDPNIPYIDFFGNDAYSTSVSTITSTINQSISAMPSIAENDGSYSNLSTLATASLVNGGLYNSFQLNDHFPPQGIYDAHAAYYANWTIGTIPPLRHGGQTMQRLLTSLNKIGPLVATASKEQMNGFNIETDTPASSYNSFKMVGNYPIGFVSSDSSVGMAINQGSYIYCASDTGGSVTFQTRTQPIAATVGHLDANGNWVVDASRSVTDNGNGTYSITYNTTETLRLELPPANPFVPLAGYWTFDEGSGTTAADSSGNGQTGTLFNSPTWVSGKLNSALSFNGSSSYLSANWGILTGNAARTIALWFKTSSTANANWISWGSNVANQLSQVGIYNGALGYLGYNNDLTVSATPYADGNWHHLAVTFDGSIMRLYLDGAQVNTSVTTLATGTSALNIGRSITGSGYYNGVLDEVRVYSGSLSASEVQSLATLLPVATGYWAFDEGSGTTAADSSGAGQTGTLFNSPAWVSGKLNSALSFNGSSSYLSANWGILTGNAARTIALWFKTSSTANANWISWGSNVANQLSQVGIYNGALGYLGYNNDLTVSATPYADGNWHHLAVTFDGTTLRLYIDGAQVNTSTTTLATGTSALNIGRSITASNYYNGSLDEVHIYSEALSTSQIRDLASLEFGYWKFDEGSGTTAIDSSGNGQTGTLFNSPTWVSGKLNGALSFNGSTTYVSTSWNELSGNAARTIALWFKTNSTANSDWVSWGTNFSNQLSQVGIYNGGLGYLGYANDLTVSATPYEDGNWHHLAVTFDGTTMILYLDGVQVNTRTTTLATGYSRLNIGRSITASNYYSGVLDEVRIYNQALSASQVNQLYTLS